MKIARKNIFPEFLGVLPPDPVSHTCEQKQQRRNAVATTFVLTLVESPFVASHYDA